MKYQFLKIKSISLFFCGIVSGTAVYGQTDIKAAIPDQPLKTLLILLLLISILMLGAAVYYLYRIKTTKDQWKKQANKDSTKRFNEYIDGLTSSEIEEILKLKDSSQANEGPRQVKSNGLGIPAILLPALLLASEICFGQGAKPRNLLQEPGIIITAILILLPLLAGILIMIVKTAAAFRQQRNKYNLKEAKAFADYLKTADAKDQTQHLVERKTSLDYHLTDHELAGEHIGEAIDDKGIISNVQPDGFPPFVAVKKKALKRPNIDPSLSKLIICYLCCAAFWLVFGTTVGEYVGIKFVAPDADHVSWLSFGRLRPVHTNAVFWGWASLAMLGLGYYVVPTVSNTKLASIKLGWYSLFLINASVILGTFSLMAGINNGGGEYREYIWPVALLLAAGLLLTLINFFKTIAKRTTKEIYVSNWYIVSALMFVLVISTVGYTPWWQKGLGETIVQAYYMHSAVGMWFMFFTLGLVYYFLPQQLNKPIYSYSLGILAFWAQILFYTMVGTHHFVFSSIPWWLQTTAIVASIGMIIPVGAGFTNFIMTFKGAWHKLAGSYTLPFFLVGIVFYLTASLQGTAEAFRSTNLIWHFTDFTVAHSHLSMYGIISFFMWACTYSLLPRLTGREAPQITIGAHFWLALIGLLFYTVPLMYGATLKGLSWIEGKPFTEGLVLMAPYWLWRAIGGSLMWMSHLFFAYNIYKMVANYKTVGVKEAAIERLNQGYTHATLPLKTGS